MEELILAIAEKSILSAGFLYLLYYLVQNMGKITLTLEKVSDTLLRIDMRVGQLESRIKELEDEGRGT